MKTKLLLCLAAVVIAAPATAATAEPAAAGDTYVYRVINRYSKESRGELRVRVEQAGADGTTVSVTPSRADAGVGRTEVRDRDGNWLRHPLDSHGRLVEYSFATPYPAYAFPLDVGKSWSSKVKAGAADEGRARTVRVDGKVLRNERVRVPAGEFDTIVIRRRTYAGDSSQMYSETRTDETEWYAPALRRAVRLERTSEWRDIGMCGRGTPCDRRGDWDLLELIEASVKR